MTNYKHLRLDCRFKLPEDFEGNEIDAAKLMLKYLTETAPNQNLDAAPCAGNTHAAWNHNAKTFPFTGQMGVLWLDENHTWRVRDDGFTASYRNGNFRVK